MMNDDYLNYNKLKLFFSKLKTLFATKEDIKELRGEDGISITSVEQTTSSTADDGMNILTVTLSDGTQSTFNVKNGSKGSSGATGTTGTRGSMIYWGTAITGTSTTATIFSSSGVTSALVNDLYLNTSTWNIYQCTTAGAASTAKWNYKGNIKGATGATGANATTTAVATTSANGLMSKEMVQKLGAIDGITSDINSESTTIAASSKMVHDLNDSLTYEKENIPSSFSNNDVVVVEKFGKLCILQVGRNKNALTAKTTYDICTLPEKYKPTQSASNMISVGQTSVQAYFLINASGKVMVTPYSDLPAQGYFYTRFIYFAV